MTCRGAAFVLVGSLFLSRSAPACDMVTLTNDVAGVESGVIAWGHGAMHDGVHQTTVKVGRLDRGDPANQAVSFTVGRPPAINEAVPWTAGKDKIVLDYPDTFTVPVKFWILCPDDACSSVVPTWKIASLYGFLIWANTRLEQERAGFSLVPDGPDWISDETTKDRIDRSVMMDFDSLNCGKLAAAISSWKTSDALNVYIVRTVNGEGGAGHYCHTDNLAVVGRNAIWGTMLHELAHDLGLDHTDGEAWEKKLGGKRNIMYSSSSRRRFLSEGQVFRMHFRTRSGLNGSLKGHVPTATTPRTPRECDPASASPPALPCPAVDALPWGTP